MGKSNIYLWIGRAVITIFLILIFILALAETIDRNNLGRTEPNNYKDTVQVMQYVKTNLASAPINNFTVNSPSAQNKDKSVLYTWSVAQDWCNCINTTTNMSTKLPYLGECTAQDSSSISTSCKTYEAVNINLYNWKGTDLKIVSSQSWSFPTTSNKTCESSFESYDSTTELCTRNHESFITNIKTSNTTVTQSDVWTLAGRFASENSTVDSSVNMLTNANLNSTTLDNSTGIYVYETDNTEGAAYVNIKASLNGLPCLSLGYQPSPTNKNDTYPVTGQPSGCGYWGTSSSLYEIIDANDQWDFFVNNDASSNTSFFEHLFGFKNVTVKENVTLYAEKKLAITQSDFCYGWVKDPDTQSNIEDIPNLNAMRSVLANIGFIVFGVAVVSFVVYLIATRVSKRVTKESVGAYIFWFEHGLGCLYAIVAIAIGSLTTKIMATIENDNSYLNSVASASCVSNVPEINKVYSYLATGIDELYTYISTYNDWNVYASIVFLVLEGLLLILWLILFSCQENLEDEDLETKKLRN